jgi:hypothetical protein
MNLARPTFKILTDFAQQRQLFQKPLVAAVCTSRRSRVHIMRFLRSLQATCPCFPHHVHRFLCTLDRKESRVASAFGIFVVMLSARLSLPSALPRQLCRTHFCAHPRAFASSSSSDSPIHYELWAALGLPTNITRASARPFLVHLYASPGRPSTPPIPTPLSGAAALRTSSPPLPIQSLAIPHVCPRTLCNRDVSSHWHLLCNGPSVASARWKRHHQGTTLCQCYPWRRWRAAAATRFRTQHLTRVLGPHRKRQDAGVSNSSCGSASTPCVSPCRCRYALPALARVLDAGSSAQMPVLVLQPNRFAVSS